MRFKIERASPLFGSKFTVFALFYFIFEGNFPSTSPRRDLYLAGRFNGGFFASQVWGADFRNFTVCDLQKDNLFARWSRWSSWSWITIGTSSSRFTIITSHTITTRLTLLSFVTFYSDDLSLFTFWSCRSSISTVTLSTL